MGDPVEPADQGANEQSIIASGMTVEEWQEKHPGQALGPAPEDIGQVTTDPPDGGELTDEEAQEAAELLFPSTKTEPEHNLIDDGQAPLEDPQVSDLEVPSDEVEHEQDEVENGHDHSHSGLTTHAQLNAYISEHNLFAPDNWNDKTVADKKAWLDLQQVK